MTTTAYDPVAVAEVRYVASISDYNAPTVAELNAGTRLTNWLTDGLNGDVSPQFLPAGTLADRVTPKVPSVVELGEATSQFLGKRDTTATDSSVDTVYNLLPRDTVGYWAIAPYGVGGASNAFAVGDTVDIIPMQVASRRRILSRGSLYVVEIAWSTTDVPNENYDLAS